MAEAGSNGSSTPLPPPPPPPETEEPTPQVLKPVPSSQVMPDERKSILRSRFFDAPKFGLPQKWLVEHRPRTSPKYLGKVDQFFYEPDTGRQFRSLSSVEKHLGRELPAMRELMITMKKKSPRRLFVPPAQPGRNPTTPIQTDDDEDNDGDDHGEPEIIPENSESGAIKIPGKEKRTSNCSIDFGNPPESVTWALADAANDILIPHILDTRISDEQKDYWAENFKAINNAKNYASQSEVSRSA